MANNLHTIRVEALAEEGKQQEPPPFEDVRSRDIASLLDSTLRCLGGAWPSASPVVRRICDLHQRLREERLQLAILGQFKRGKSTFLNAVLGEPLLPTGVIPLTAIPTFITWGPRPLVRVTYRTARPADEFDVLAPDNIRRFLFGFVAEEANPRNRLDVARVDLFYPAPILRNGVVLIDTPGIGSTHRHNTDAALAVLPECDAALFVVSADPPITEAELAYLKMVRPKVAQLFFVLSKADYLGPDDLQVAVEFLRKTLQQSPRAGSDTMVFCVSALEGLKAKQSGDAAALEKSGIAGIESYLCKYLAHEKLASLRTAVIRKASELLAEAEADLALRIRALEIPVEDLQKCTAALEEALGRIAGEGRLVRDLLAGDRRRAVEQLEMHAERLRQRGRQYLTDVLEPVLSRSDQGEVESAAQDAVAAAIPEFFEHELSETSHEFSRTIEEILKSHQRRIDELVNLVRRTAADLFDVPYAALAESERFKLGREPYWVTQQWSDKMAFVPAGLVNRLLPATMRRARLRGQLEGRVTELVQRNVENLRWATLQGLDGTFRRFSTMLDERLAAAIEATKGAVAAASTKRSTASNRIDLEVAGLQRTLGSLTEIRAELTGTAIQVTS